MQLPEAVICHYTKGRLRIKIPSKKGNVSYFDHVCNVLKNSGTCKNVAVNPINSSCVINTEEEIEKLKDFAQSNGLFDLKMIDTEKRRIINYTIKQTFNNFDLKIRRFFNDEIDLAGATLIALIGLTAYQIGRGNFSAPAWYTSLWYAFNVFLKSEK
jgi:hypothetical protein